MDVTELRGLMAEQEMLSPNEHEPSPQMLGQLLNDDKVILELDKFPLWGGLTSSAKLSFIDANDRDILMHHFEADVCRLIRTNPSMFRDGKSLFKVNQCRTITRLNYGRSVGTNNPNLKNERIAITSERKEVFSSDTAQTKKSMIGKLFGLG